MRPVLQTTFRPSEGDGAGNCFQAALASVMEVPLEDCPHVAAMSKDRWQGELDRWLAGHGLAVLPLDCKETMPWLPPDLWVLMVGKSPRGDFGHVIVGRTSATRYEYAHDPHPSGEFITGDPTCIWVFLALDPSQKRGSTTWR